MSVLPAITIVLISLTVVCNGDDVCNWRQRVYDIVDFGYPNLFHGWADVQGQGLPGDYCRIIGNSDTLRLDCVLGGGGTQDKKDQYLYESALKFDVGYTNTWYMKDENGDGRDDYCRCVGNGDKSHISCNEAGPRGFIGSKAHPGSQYTFTPEGGNYRCESIALFPEFGKKYVKPA